jgi:hypothetical protein
MSLARDSRRAGKRRTRARRGFGVIMKCETPRQGDPYAAVSRSLESADFAKPCVLAASGRVGVLPTSREISVRLKSTATTPLCQLHHNSLSDSILPWRSPQPLPRRTLGVAVNDSLNEPVPGHGISQESEWRSTIRFGRACVVL